MVLLVVVLLAQVVLVKVAVLDSEMLLRVLLPEQVAGLIGVLVVSFVMVTVVVLVSGLPVSPLLLVA